MTRHIVTLLCAAALWLPALAADPIRVVATTTDLAAIARAVTGDLAQVASVTSGAEDPHFLQARPSYILMARDADLWICVGMDLEIGWEPAILSGARNHAIMPGGPHRLDASAEILRMDVPKGPISRAQGDVHPHGNPHYWLDPLNGRIVAESIAKKLGALYPHHAPAFYANLARFQNELDARMFGPALVKRVGGEKLWVLLLRNELDPWLKQQSLQGELAGWLGRMRPLAGSGLVLYHKSWNYFANRFNLKIVAELEPLPGIPPSPAHLAGVVQAAKAQDAKAILIEPFYPVKPAEFVA